MAQKRMFDISIVDNDKFIELPVSSRLLYYELGMRADDEGFISPKKVLRMLALSEDDLKLLIVKGFLLSFLSGVVVITDWKMNNYLNQSRIKKTIYTEEKDALGLDMTGRYVLNNGSTDVKQMLNNGSTNVKQMLNQYSIEENRIEYINTKKTKNNPKKQKSQKKEEPSKELKEIVEYYNLIYGKNVSSVNGFSENYEYWSHYHDTEQIKKAIRAGKADAFWSDKLTLTILFRRKNTRGEAVDYVEDLAGKIKDANVAKRAELEIINY